MVNEVISRSLKSALCFNLFEPAYISEDLRPDGITTIPFNSGKSAIWDFTCPSTQVQSAINLNKRTSVLCNFKEEQKIKKYSFLSNKHIFHPVAVDSIGSYGPCAEAFIREIGKRIYETSGSRQATFYLRQRMSIAIQRGNSCAILFSIKKTFIP